METIETINELPSTITSQDDEIDIIINNEEVIILSLLEN